MKKIFVKIRIKFKYDFYMIFFPLKIGGEKNMEDAEDGRGYSYNRGLLRR